MPTKHEQRLANRVASSLNREHGVLVTLRRGSASSAEFSARRSDKEHSAIGADLGLEIKLLMRVYDFLKADLLLNGSVVEPRAGDIIVEGTEAYEVQPPDDKRPAVESIYGGLYHRCNTQRLVGFDVEKVAT